MKRVFRRGAHVACIAIAAAVLLAPAARASGSKLPVATNPQWQSECGSCHVAYPPRMLPARSWRAIVDRLDRHFGTDASIDADTAASIRSFLEAYADRGRNDFADPPGLRITESARFIRKHARIPAATWRSDEVGSAANCGACHAGAERGRYSDDDVRIPR
jgi:hypothetical protein